MMIWTNLLQIYKNIVLKMKNIIQLDHSELPDNVDDARCLAGLLGQVANESVAICKQVDPNSIPGGMNSVLSENTQNNYNLSLFERFMNNRHYSYLLNTQYRYIQVYSFYR